MLDLIEQSSLYRVVVIVTALASFLQVVWRISGQGPWGSFPRDLSPVVIGALLGGFLFPIIIVLVPGRVGTLLYTIFSFGNPSYLVIVGLIGGALFGVIYRQVADRIMIALMFAIAMAVGVGFMAFFVGAIVAAIAPGGPWGAILDQALSWGKYGAMIGAVLGLLMGAVTLAV